MAVFMQNFWLTPQIKAEIATALFKIHCDDVLRQNCCVHTYEHMFKCTYSIKILVDFLKISETFDLWPLQYLNSH